MGRAAGCGSDGIGTSPTTLSGLYAASPSVRSASVVHAVWGGQFDLEAASGSAAPSRREILARAIDHAKGELHHDRIDSDPPVQQLSSLRGR